MHCNIFIKKIKRDAKVNEIRLNKYLSESGVCSRREADRLITEGKVIVDGEIAGLGVKVNESSVVYCNGKRVNYGSPKVIYAYNKPIGQVCTAKNADKDSIFQFVTFPEHVTYVGRLDKDSTGLLLLTNDGELANQIQKSRNNHEKEYHVRVNSDISEDFINKMSEGVPILDTVTKPCKVKKTGSRNFSIILTQGLNRQIRRMCDALHVRVVHLKRVRIMNIRLGNLRPGEYRALTTEEERILRQMAFGSKTGKENRIYDQ